MERTMSRMTKCLEPKRVSRWNGCTHPAMSAGCGFTNTPGDGGATQTVSDIVATCRTQAPLEAVGCA
jgi:hypothetical protein